MCSRTAPISSSGGYGAISSVPVRSSPMRWPIRWWVVRRGGGGAAAAAAAGGVINHYYHVDSLILKKYLQDSSPLPPPLPTPFPPPHHHYHYHYYYYRSSRAPLPSVRGAVMVSNSS